MAGDSNYDSVSLLLPFDGPNGSTTFNDRSNTRKTITAYGGTLLSTSQSKFNGASVYFDGVNDNLEINPTGWYLSSSESSSALGAVDFTIECWVYIDSTTYTYRPFTLGAPGSGTGSTANYRQGLRCQVSSTAVDIIAGNYNVDGASGYMHLTAALSLSTGWHHVAFQSISNTPSIFVDGVGRTLSNGGIGTASSFSATKLYCPRVVQVQSTGAYGGVTDTTLSSSAVFYRGYIDALRITKGIARYTANFTPPTEPNPIGLPTVLDVNYSSVSLLLNADGSTIVDESPTPKALTANGNAALTKVDSKVGAGSLVFDGAGDYLSTPLNTAFQLTSEANFTVEAWVNTSSTAATQGICGNRSEVPASGWALRLNAGGGLFFYFTAGSTATSSLTVAANTWTHVAAVRSGGSVTLYVNGVANTPNVFSNGVTSTAGLSVGRQGVANTGQDFNGYIDALRITKGVARYTANFTPPNYALANYAPVATQKNIVLTGQTPSVPVAALLTPTQKAITLAGQTPGIPSPFTGTAAQRSITLAGQAPTANIGQVDTGILTGTGFSTIPAISWVVDDTATVSGTGFVSAQVILGGATVLGGSFSSTLTATYTTDNTAYITGSAFITAPIISTISNAVIGVTGRGFRTIPELLGGAKVQGVGFKTTLSAIADVPSSASIAGTVFSTAPTIEAVAISSAIVIGGGFVSGLAYSKITGRSFSSRPVIKTAFAAEYAEAYVMNVLTGAVSRYENYPFMSLARIGSSYYGFAADGLYELTGKSDLEDDVLGTIRTNDEDLDAFNSRNIPYMYLNGEDDYSVTAVVDEVAQPTFTSGFGGRRVRLARGSKGRYWYFEIGGIRHLQGLEYTPDRLTRKVK